MKTKSLLILMALVICMSSFMGFTTSAFSDVAEGDKHAYAITYLTEKGVIHGYEDGTYKPNNNITRAEFLTLLLESINITNFYGEMAVKTGFADVDIGTHNVNDAGNQYTITNQAQHWAAGYIKIAVDKKIVSGYGNGLFKPDAPVTYEEAIKMVVCALGREGMAQTKVDTLKIPFWPDAYLSVGNDLLIAKETDYTANTPATRGNIAQMLYNVKDVTPIIAPNVKPGYVGGGGGGGGDYGYDDETIDDGGTPATPVSNLSARGQVVAAVKKSGGTKKKFIIDENIIINGQPVSDVGTNFVILKLDVPINGNDYEQFYTTNDFSSYLGYKVELKYTFNPDYEGPNGAVQGRNDIENIYIKDTEVITILSSDINDDDTRDKNSNPNTQETYICYTDGEEDYDQSLYTNDLSTLTVVYNNKIIDVDSHTITLEDLMPQDGNIKLVDAYEDRSFDLIWVNSYETYVVASKDRNTKTITDKFRKDEHGEALKLSLDAENVEIYFKGEEKEFSEIPSNNAVLTVAKSKCGTNVEVRYEKISYIKSGAVEVRTVNGVKDSFVIGSKSYKISDYYLRNVDSELEFTPDDTLTLYYNSSNKVFWVTISEPAYSTGYLMSAVEPDQLTGKISLNILKTDGTVTTFTMAERQTKYITKAYTCLDDAEIVPDSMTNANGYLYKNLSESMIYASLQENAAIINAGKPAGITTNASVAQPVMYIATSGNVLTSLVTAELDTASAFTGTNKKQYTKANNGTHVFTGEDATFSATSSSTFIFVPNDRKAYSTGDGYKIGTPSSSAISKKLTEYMYYNIEPYYVTDATGSRSRKIFVVYNQNLDATPNYRSENMVVKSIVGTGENEYKITGCVDSVTSTKTYTVYTSAEPKGALLDENFERTSTTVEVGIGDVIRVGYSPIGAVADIEIILDASDGANSKKAFAISKDGQTMTTINPSKLYVYYYARVGEIVKIDPSLTPEYCNFEINGGVNSQLWIGPGYNNTSILLYDLTETALNNAPKSAKMQDLQEGDILFVKQGEDLTTKQIYAVRPATTP